MTYLLRFPLNAVASSSRVTLPIIPRLGRYISDYPEETPESDPNHYDATGRLAGIDERPAQPTTLFAAKFPAFFSRDMIQARYEKYQIRVNEVYIPLAKNEEGKVRKNNRSFAFVEVKTEEDMRKALAINPEKMGHVSTPSRQTIEEARTYADWAISSASKKAKADRHRPVKPWEQAKMQPEENRRRNNERQWQ